MTKQQQIDTLQKQLDAANEQIASIDNAMKEQYVNTATGIISQVESWFQDQSKRAYITYNDINYDDLGGLENTLMDYPEDSDEYKSAYAFLHDHDRLVKRLYEDATTCVYDVGYCGFGPAHERLIRDIRFCGKDWLMECCEERIKKEGY